MAKAKGGCLLPTIDKVTVQEQLPTHALRAALGGYSAAGRKARNDDAIVGQVPDDDYERHLRGVVACIADGLSSARNADQAAQLAVLQFTRDFYSAPESWTVKNCSARLLASLNSWFHSQNRSGIAENAGFAATFTALILRSTTAHIVHVGDTRCYRLHNGRLTQLTEDHTAPHLGQSEVLTRALGIDADIRVDYRQEPAREGDLFLLTSDGVHGALTAEQMTAIVADAAPQSRADLEEVSRQLCEAALAAGSTDNVSCLMVLAQALPSETLSEAHSRLTRRAIPPVMQVGNRLDDWRIVEVLHASTRSHVYLVERPDRQGRYVLKAPSANFAGDLRYLEGFALERWVGRRIRNRQVMQILPGEDSRFLYFVAEYVAGTTLRQWMADHPEPALDEVLPLVRSIVSAVRVFHRMDVVHRDLKPENIIIATDGTATIIDFGSAQVTGFADLRSEPIADWPEGSLNYIAPELLTGGEAKFLSDLFSIAAIAWEMLTGQLPFAREGATRISASEGDRLRGVFGRLRPELPPAVEQVLLRALSHDPAKRPQAMSEFVAALDRAGASAGLRTEFVPLIDRGSKEMWRNWALIATLAALVFAVILFGRLG